MSAANRTQEEAVETLHLHISSTKPARDGAMQIAVELCYSISWYRVGRTAVVRDALEHCRTPSDLRNTRVSSLYDPTLCLIVIKTEFSIDR